MRLSGPAKLLRIHIGESDRYEGRPLHLALMELFQAKGIAGTTVLRGVEGFGASNHLHTTRILSLSDDLPIVITIIDTAERIDAFVPELEELITEGLVIIDDVHVVRYVGRPKDADR